MMLTGGGSLWLCVLMLVPLSLAREPPQIVERIHRRQQVKTGETIKLPCPVEANPEPLFEWTKDGESINAGWERYRKSTRGALRIKDAVAEDSGRYVCKATNGFGSVDVKYTVYVMPDTNDTSGYFDEEGFPKLPDSGIGVPPQFSHPDQMSHSHVMKPIGAFARLKCRASGRPRPRIVWFKDGVMLIGGVPGHLGKWVLKLSDLQARDSGRYTCRVTNQAGSINFTYTVEVVGALVEKPILIHPENLTVPFSGMASFLCRVQSVGHPPAIKWLKRVDNQEDMKQKNATITVNGQQFLVLKTGKVLARKGDVYLNKLTIYDAQQTDSGMYVCVGANSMGHSVRSAFLTVLPDPRQLDSRIRAAERNSFLENSSLPLIVGVPVAVIIVVVIATVYMVWRRQKQSPKQQKTAVRHPAPPVRRSPLPPPMTPQQAYPKQYEHSYSAVPTQQYHVAPAPSREHIINNYSDMHSAVSGPNTHTPSACNGMYQSYPYNSHYCR